MSIFSKPLKHEKLIVGLMIVVWVLLLISVYILKYSSLRLVHSDQGIFWYVIENLRNSHSWFDFSYDYCHRLGAHFSILLLLFVPLHYISNSPLVMLVVQAIVAGTGAYAVYLISRHFFTNEKDSIYRILCVVAYISYIPFLKALFFDFDLTRLAPAIILFFLYFAVLKKRDLAALPFALLLIMTRETLPLIIAGAGLYMFFFDRERLRGSVYLISGLLIFLVLNFVIMPYFLHSNPNYIFGKSGLPYMSHYQNINGSGIGSVFISLLSNSTDLIKNFFIVPKVKWLNFFILIASLGFIPLLKPKYMVIPVFTIFIYYLATSERIFIIKGQFFCEIYPVFFISFIAGLKWIKEKYSINIRKILCSFLFTFFIVSLLYNFADYTIRHIGFYNQYSDENRIIKSDPLKIRNDDHAALITPGRLFFSFGWKKYMTNLARYDLINDLVKKDSNIDKIYFIMLDDKDIGENDYMLYHQMIPLIKQDGFIEAYKYKNFIIYMKKLGKN